MGAAHEIMVMGREFKIRSEDPTDHVQAIATYVNGKLEELSDGKSGAPSQQLLLMASLNLADELFKLRSEHSELTEKIRATSRRLLERITPQPHC